MVRQAPYDRLYIGGEWVASDGDGRVDVVSPSSEEVLTSVVTATASDMDRAVAAARRAFDGGEWAATDLSERIAIVQRLRDLLADNKAAMAELLVDEIGCPSVQSEPIQVDSALAITDAYLRLAPDYPLKSIRHSAAGRALITRAPVGVVAAVVPWNVPVCISVQKIVPAILAGCTMVLKPALESPLNAYFLADLLHEAGVPAGVVNIVPADRDVSEHLVTHPGVDKVTFTGSTAAGRRIASLCGQDLRRITLELGGKSAGIVLDDADLEATVSMLRLASLRNSGQVCSLKTRLLVSERRRDEFVDQLVAMVQSMPVGDPHDGATQIGPMISARQRARVEEYIESGNAQGAKMVLGGGRPSHLDRGWFVEPTIFVDVQPDMRIAQEEIFGPVLSVLTYRDEDEAIALANDSDYGLNGAVYTTDFDRGLALAQRIRTGAVELNGSPIGHSAPAGGFKASGIGRENGPEGLEAFTELRSIGLPAGFEVDGVAAG
jgi:aldehyde dehydrogenase (NAD+)